jgi:MFS family permease
MAHVLQELSTVDAIDLVRAAPPLWRDRRFGALWAGQSVSLLGSRVTAFALPLVAALSLGASAGEMGLLTAAELAPSLALGLVAGVWVDRRPRRPILIAADLGRAALLATIPAAALAGVLRIEQLYAVALLAGTLGLFADVARSSLLPTLVGRERLADANGKLEMSRSVARVAGPGLAGALVELLTAPVAVAADALSFLVSAACLARLRVAERPRPARAGRSLWAEVGEGLRLVRGSPSLRAQVGATALLNFFAGGITAVEILFFTRELGVAPAVLGAVIAASGVAAVVGAIVAARTAARFGLGPTMVGALALFSLAHFPVALATGPPALVTALLVLGIGGIQLAFPVYGVGAAALLQGVTPDHLLGRVTASVRFLLVGPPLLGALVGGALGDALGLRATMLLGAVGQLVPCLWLYLSPVRAMRQPAPPGDAPPEAPLGVGAPC